MTRRQHYLEAERLLEASENETTDFATLLAVRAQVHATLALANVGEGDPIVTPR